MGKDKNPLIYVKSYIPIKRLSSKFKEDLISANIPIGRILRKYNIESRREIQSVEIKESTDDLRKIFNTNLNFLSRNYNIIHEDKILIWIEEIFPVSFFLENKVDNF